MPVHYGGYPANMDRIMEIAQKHGLFVVEDCAEGHGSEWHGRKIGSIGNAGAFSFQMGKPLTCGEGGAVTYNDEALKLSCYAYSRTVKKADGSEETYYMPAGNWRMSEFVGAHWCQFKKVCLFTEDRSKRLSGRVGEWARKTRSFSPFRPLSPSPTRPKCIIGIKEGIMT